jgi:surface antigen
VVRCESSDGSLAAFVAAAVFLFAYVLISADGVLAGEAPAAKTIDPPCHCREQHAPLPARPQPQALPGEAPYSLDERDEVAVLDAVQLALAEVGDGATYVWHRSHGQLSGYVHVAKSYRGGGGEICRSMVVMLTSGARHQSIETAACRMADGRWQFNG